MRPLWNFWNTMYMHQVIFDSELYYYILGESYLIVKSAVIWTWSGRSL